MDATIVKIDWENGCEECGDLLRAKAVALKINLEEILHDTKPFVLPADLVFFCEHNPPEYAPSIFLDYQLADNEELINEQYTADYFKRIGKDYCVYCHKVIDRKPEAPPGVEEDAAWSEEENLGHAFGCDWIATRAHRLDHSILDHCSGCGVVVDNRPGWTYCAGGGPECYDRCPDCGPKHAH